MRKVELLRKKSLAKVTLDKGLNAAYTPDFTKPVTHIHTYQGFKAIARRHDQQRSLFLSLCLRLYVRPLFVTLPPTVPGYLISNLSHKLPLSYVESFPSKRIFLHLSWYSFLRQLMNEEICYLN